MRFIVIFISSLLSWSAYDVNLFRRRNDSLYLKTAELSLEVTERQLQRRKIKRDRLDMIPKKYRDVRKPFKQRCNYFSTKPRDVRFSDQMKIRRMFNNC